MTTTLELTQTADRSRDRENAARALCAAGAAVAGRAVARAARRCAGRSRRCRAATQMRVQQLWHWIYVRGVQDFGDMTSVSKELRAALAQRFTLDRPEIVAEQVSVDGTRKWLLRLPGEIAGAPARGRVRLHSGGRSRHAVRLQPGRLHAQLHVLPHRHAASRSQSDAGRDRRPDHGRARSAGD